MKYLVEYHYGDQYYKELLEATSPFEALEQEKNNAVAALAPVVVEKKRQSSEWADWPDLTSPSQFTLVICSEADEQDIAEWNSEIEQTR
jgi:hypothetical protein